jgi:acid phosphatase
MFPNPNCYRLRKLAKEFNKTVSDMMKDKFKSLSKRLSNYVDSVSLDSHPSANGILGKKCGIFGVFGKPKLIYSHQILDTLIAAKAHGFKIPSDIDESIFHDLEDIVVKEWFYGAMVSEEVRRLSLGRLMGVIRDRMLYREQGSSQDDEKLKLAIYSGHDT